MDGSRRSARRTFLVLHISRLGLLRVMCRIQSLTCHMQVHERMMSVNYKDIRVFRKEKQSKKRKTKTIVNRELFRDAYIQPLYNNHKKKQISICPNLCGGYTRAAGGRDSQPQSGLNY